MGRRRAGWSVATALVLSAVLAGQALAAVAWTAPTLVGGAYSWNRGHSLARTGTSPGYLHALYSTNFVGGSLASDAGPYQGIYYTRSSDGGTSWATPTRVSQTAKHGGNGAVAAAGSYVYAAWLTFASLEVSDPASSRVLYFRRNSSTGASGSWGTIKRLTPTAGRLDFPVVAAAGTYVYVIYTDSDTGSVKLAISADRGATWSVKSIGSTTYVQGAWGYSGRAVVAAAGANVGVAWMSDASGALKARISADNGASFGSATTLISSGGGLPAAHALGDRIAFAWDKYGAIRMRLWQSGAWQPARTVDTFSASSTYKDGFQPAIALVGSAAVGVAYGGCRVTDCTRMDLLWRESTDNGATWKARKILQNSTTTTSRQLNEYASVAWGGSSTRYVLFNSAPDDYATYRLRFTVGTGAP